jgi:D-arabinose 5-phosphate isomerase GutQ
MSDAVHKTKAPEEVDTCGMIAAGSSLVSGAACDALCAVLLELRGYSKKQFGVTRPEGTVGKKTAENK